MADQREAFALAREFQDSEAVQMALDGEIATEPTEAAVQVDDYRDSGQPFAVYSAAMVHAATLIQEKGWKPAAAAAAAHEKFQISPESMTADSVMKHARRYGVAPPRKQGRALTVDLDAELQLVNIILLM